MLLVDILRILRTVLYPACTMIYDLDKSECDATERCNRIMDS